MDKKHFMEIVKTLEAIVDSSGSKKARQYVEDQILLEDLRVFLKHDNLVLRREALFMARFLPIRKAVPELIGILKNDPSSVLRHEAAFILGEMGSREALAPLLEAATQDSSILVRHEASEALGELGMTEALPTLEKLSKNDNIDIAETARISMLQIQARS